MRKRAIKGVTKKECTVHEPRAVGYKTETKQDIKMGHTRGALPPQVGKT
ncbi:MAG: hypothetical protein HYR83_08660 [Planctomycetes bacterium]|nr:hypothetical protein [Planctomycetota bacterium]